MTASDDTVESRGLVAAPARHTPGWTEVGVASITYELILLIGAGVFSNRRGAGVPR